MTLRGRIFALFLALAAGPLIVLALLISRGVSSTVDALVAEQVRALGQRSAAALEHRQAVHRSDMLLLAENDETLRLLHGSLPAGQRDSAVDYFNDVWSLLREQYYAVVIADAAGTRVLVLGDTATARSGALRERPVHETGRVIGAVRAYVKPAAFFPASELEARFGASGVTVLLDSTGAIVYPADSTAAAATVPGVLRAQRDTGSLRYRSNARDRIAYHVPVAAAGLSVLVSSDVGDFAGPFARLSRILLLTIVIVTLLATSAFAALLARATGSLRALTLAADRVGRGDFTPDLPRATRDDVGRLTTAFGLMVTKIRDMLLRVEASRQMAVLGEFAARLSHELRNPLTAIKLNLQSLDRDSRANRLNSAEAARPLSIALREIGRLNDVLARVLELAHSQTRAPRRIRLQTLAEEVYQLVATQATQKRVELRLSSSATRDEVHADPAELKGAVLNLVLNALDAAPADTAIDMHLSNEEEGSHVLLRLRDAGAGVPAGLREDIFRPFFTTKAAGTGLGLSMALRTARELGGELSLGNHEGAGAEFLLSLPLVTVETVVHAAVDV